MPDDTPSDGQPAPDGQTPLVSHSRIVLEGRERRAYVAGAEEPLTYGVAGDLRDYYGAHRLPELGAPVDHIIAGVAGWLHGTLHGALHARRVEFDPETFTADVEGRFERIPSTSGRGTLRIASIHVRYHLAIPSTQRESAERAVAVHARACPAHESVKDAIEVTWSVDYEER